MKSLILLLAVFGLALSASAQSTRVSLQSDLNYLILPRQQQLLVNTVTNTVPVRLSSTNLWFRRATLLGLKQWRTNNTGTVYIGVNSTNNTQPFPILTGAEAKLEAPVGTKYNLYDWYLDAATDGDGLVLILDHF